MRPGTLVLFTDRPAQREGLLRALDAVAPCHPRDAAAVVPAGDCIGFVADVDLLQPSLLRGLRALIAEAPRLPRLFLMRDTGARSLATARSLGASLCLPPDTAAGAVAEAMRTHLTRPVPEAVPLRPAGSGWGTGIAQAADRAGAVLAGLLDAARLTGTVDPMLVEHGLDPILGAVGEAGLGAWLDTVRAYDDATYQHCLLVAGLAATFAIDLGFSLRDREQVVRAALVHDVGKALIPLEILNKAGPLEPAERTVMRTHAALGHAILVEAGGFDASILAVVRHHHELLDGTGYPDRLSGDAIPDIVRMITVCDIYAALAERRPYRAPMPPLEAFRILRGMEGKLDMALARSFERAVAKA
ncbi:HD-GYP domain-containing protein [Methylobacterium sp. J-076]|uniref:HD-GYP domain-containing protein n=1 Tax=Methylobacterium sp. J-076 TaxID=2836655 RepID=UPI001FBB464B|nr:HD domain-containing phosphohydrolase [Methylobacterium sp. J-076]MCJ2014921.1 HD domain-containing protein [Methylobacterium sp. J-076]